MPEIRIPNVTLVFDTETCVWEAGIPHGHDDEQDDVGRQLRAWFEKNGQPLTKDGEEYLTRTCLMRIYRYPPKGGGHDPGWGDSNC